MPIIYALIAISEDESMRTVMCLYDNRPEAEAAMAQESFWIDQGEYGDEEEGTTLVIEETEVPDIDPERLE